MKSWEVERLFNDDIREKRKAGSGSFHKRGKGVKHGISGALKTPYHYMKAKEKKKLNGEVTTMNMYTTILNWQEWQTKDQEDQKLLLTKWREIYSNTKIMEELAKGRDKPFNAQSFADIVNALGCPPKAKGGSKPRKATAKKNSGELHKLPEMSLLEFAEGQPKTQAIQEEVIKTMLITKGLHLEYNGEYDVESLNRIFTKLQLLVDGESNKYKISLSLTEIIDD